MEQSGHPNLDLVLGLYSRESRLPAPRPENPGKPLSAALHGLAGIQRDLLQLEHDARGSYAARLALGLRFAAGDGPRISAETEQADARLQLDWQPAAEQPGPLQQSASHGNTDRSDNRARRLKRIVRRLLAQQADNQQS